MEELTSLKSISELGVAGVLAFAVYFLIKYIKIKDSTIGKLIDVNSEQNNQMRETNILMKELAEHQKECREYSKLGYWWVSNHQPTMETCTQCDEYMTCPHPRKFILKRKSDFK